MRVLSLFDGIACGRIALERAGVPVEKYYASEINPTAIQVAQNNYPDIEQLGDVTKLETTNLGQIDLLLGGSPCKSFSVAGQQQGFKGKSGIFWEYVRILNETEPKYFLFENVRMKKRWQDIISRTLGVQPIRINSKLVSAQLRDRFYWTNIPSVTQPKDKEMNLQSILENGTTDRTKARAILESESRPLATPSRMWHRYHTTGFTTIVYEHGFNDLEHIRYFTQTELERLQTLPEGYTRGLTRNKAAGLIGDGWTVDIIAHILSFLPKETK